RAGQGAHVAYGDEQPRVEAEHVGDTADGRRDDGYALRHRLDDAERCALRVARQHEHVYAAEEVRATLRAFVDTEVSKARAGAVLAGALVHLAQFRARACSVEAHALVPPARESERLHQLRHALQ